MLYSLPRSSCFWPLAILTSDGLGSHGETSAESAPASEHRPDFNVTQAINRNKSTHIKVTKAVCLFLIVSSLRYSNLHARTILWSHPLPVSEPSFGASKVSKSGMSLGFFDVFWVKLGYDFHVIIAAEVLESRHLPCGHQPAFSHGNVQKTWGKWR